MKLIIVKVNGCGIISVWIKIVTKLFLVIFRKRDLHEVVSKTRGYYKAS